MNDLVEIASPGFDYGALAPIFIIFGAALISIVLEALLPRESRRAAQVIVVFIALIAALVAVFLLAGTNITTETITTSTGMVPISLTGGPANLRRLPLVGCNQGYRDAGNLGSRLIAIPCHF